MISKFLKPLAKALGMTVFAVLLNACSSDNNQAATNPGNSTKTVTQLPWEALTVPDLNNLRAYVIIDGNTGSRIAMTITPPTATAIIPGLSLAPHTVQIVYEYIDGATTYTVAQSSVEPVDLTGGSTTFNMPSTAYVTTGTGFDNDSDGLSNAYELAAGTDPGDASCVVGYSLVGSCTL